MTRTGEIVAAMMKGVERVRIVEIERSLRIGRSAEMKRIDLSDIDAMTTITGETSSKIVHPYAYCESLTSCVLSGGQRPLISGLERICIAKISAVRMYNGIDRAQPCLRPRSRGIKDVSHPFTFTELVTEL